jgi:hypothetical protein
MTIISPLCYMELTQAFTVAPWKLNVQTTWRWNGNFDLISNITTVGLKAGDASVTGVFVWRNNGSLSFEPGISEFITTFDPPGLTVTSDIVFCTNPVYCRAWVAGLIYRP